MEYKYIVCLQQLTTFSMLWAIQVNLVILYRQSLHSVLHIGTNLKSLHVYVVGNFVRILLYCYIAILLHCYIAMYIYIYIMCIHSSFFVFDIFFLVARRPMLYYTMY